ncbi:MULTISPECIES: hypothetical protein [unclassified Sporosarcina]|uniref:hypothetical protein n=1 Tax=unclassified Sporosarcina TaxID=2647733 RepID=UPI002040F6F0|nr:MULTISPECIES: hypothetical protein [unclassified Sporosarcina]GKV63914.1 hypothetical protein NCCP2331_00670 [Sporosarcina sp. NCCP-2331]GLB54694.1 hypothetical protein NCCP2378_04790 [Sporosarcina sp. NCCP-2378]
MAEYFRSGWRKYPKIFLGFLIGFIIAGLVFENPDYKTGITAAAIGLLIGESLIFIGWLKSPGRRS